MPFPRLLIIGHGYVGSTLARDLNELGFPMAAVSRLCADHLPYPVLAADISSKESVRSLPESLPYSKPDVIVHCASSSRGGPEAYRAVFINGLYHLSETFQGVPVVFTSSSSVYGQTDGSLVDERSDTSPDRETSRLLCEAEAIARAGGGIALRLAGIYGPGRSVHLKKMLEGTATIDEGVISRHLNQIHRDDAAGAIAHLIATGVEQHRGSLYNVVDDVPLTQRQCYEALATFFDLPVPPDAPPALDRKRAWTDKIISNVALKATGWRPRYPSFLDAVKNDAHLVRSIRDQIAAEVL